MVLDIWETEAKRNASKVYDVPSGEVDTCCLVASGGSTEIFGGWMMEKRLTDLHHSIQLYRLACHGSDTACQANATCTG